MKSTLSQRRSDRSAGFQPAVPLASSRRFLSLVVIAFAFLVSAAPALAQGCAMCYSNAAGSSKDGQKAISKGILILLVPPLGFMMAGMGAAVRYSRKRDEAAAELDNSTEIGEQ